MQFFKIGSLIFLSVFAITGIAQQNRVENFSEYVQPYLEWAQKYPDDKELLNIFPTFKPPTIQYSENGRSKTRTEQYVTYVTRMNVTIDKNAAQLPLEKLINLESLKKISNELHHEPITAEQTMPLLVSRKGQIDNFKWCNKGSFVDYFKLPQLEKDLSHMINPERAWCSSSRHTLCVETCYPFNSAWKALVALNNSVLDPKDYGTATQSELRLFMSEGEYGARVPLARVTKINTPVRGVLEQNIFYFNQVLVWGKVVAVFQEHPTDSQKSIMTALVAFNLRRKYWDYKYKEVREVLRGESRGPKKILALNTPTGVSAGIPIYSQEIAIGIVKTLEQK